MQAVILAAGESSRFFPFNLKPKPLVKIAGEPIIAYTIRAIKKAGINDVIIVTGSKNYYTEMLGNGRRFGVKITYATLAKPTGMGDGLLACVKHIKSDFFLVNTQHIEFDELKKIIDTKRTTNKEAVLLAKKEKSVSDYGVIKVTGDHVTSFVEKPKTKTLSGYRVIGVYFLNQEFLKILKKVKPHHDSLEEAIDIYAKRGQVRVALTERAVPTLKYPWDLLKIKDNILERLTRSISKKASISEHAIIEGAVVIEAGVTISERATIKGPAYIGKNTFIGSNTLIRNGSDIEAGATIGAYMEIRGSLIGENIKTHSGFIGDSIVGQNTKIGALFSTANVRLDRGNVAAIVKDAKVDTELRALGAMIGTGVVIGERVSSMPGIIVGNNSVIGPSTTIMQNIPSDTLYYTKFAEIIKKNLPHSRK